MPDKQEKIIGHAIMSVTGVGLIGVGRTYLTVDLAGMVTNICGGVIFARSAARFLNLSKWSSISQLFKESDSNGSRNS